MLAYCEPGELGPDGSLKWIAHRLQMGSWTYVSNLLAPKSGIENQQLCQQ